MRTAALGDVAHAADDEIAAAIRRVEGRCQCLVAVVAAVVHLGDGAVEVVHEVVGAKVEGPVTGH